MAVDKKYLKENNLTEVYKRMRQINEYVITGHTREADDMQQDSNTAAPDPNVQAPAADPMAGGAPQGQMPAGNDMPQGGDMGGDPNAAPADQNAAAPDMNADPNGGMAPAEPDPTIGAEAPETGEDGEEIEDMNMEGDEAGPDDEVVDVDYLTNSQEAAEYKIDGVDDKLSKLLAIAGKFAKAIEDNDNKINDLKTELEKRNPTDTERINIRSQNSKPFSVNPGQYWDGVRAKNPNYQVVSDNEVAPNEEDKVYTITDDDIKDFNTAEVEKSFSDFPNDLLDYFK